MALKFIRADEKRATFIAFFCHDRAFSGPSYSLADLRVYDPEIFRGEGGVAGTLPRRIWRGPNAQRSLYACSGDGPLLVCR
jgi:hypothetical protein